MGEHHCPWDEVTCSYAVMFEHLDVVKWARGHDCPCTPEDITSRI